MAMYCAILILPLLTRSRPSFDTLDSADDLDIAPHVNEVSGNINSAIFENSPCRPPTGLKLIAFSSVVHIYSHTPHHPSRILISIKPIIFLSAQ
ncbi:hypothetical protein M405DRAFT_870400 [Rhizopogon salebrosus TDB-379]|nr:hypothetical protein M405DRAFT_870400 [Rhizopogon salebrosus TDB-379]